MAPRRGRRGFPGPAAPGESFGPTGPLGFRGGPDARGPLVPRRRTGAAKIALALGLAGLAVSAAGLVIQLMPRQFTAAQQHQIESWEIAGRWRTMAAGDIFPATLSYQLSARTLMDATPLTVDALRVGIAAQTGCAAGVTTAAAAVLARGGCQAVLRATYIDATRSYIMTVGVAVLRTTSAALAASRGLSPPRLASQHSVVPATLPAGVQVVTFRGAAAELYDYSRQIARSFNDGPYLIMYAVGYADSRPHVLVNQDPYSFAEMTSMAQGVAQSVANRLTVPPAVPRCPGAPGC
jgi:hypothetical protein